MPYRKGAHARRHGHHHHGGARRPYELARNDLGSIGDVWIALELSKDFDAAQRLGTEVAGDIRLLNDIGWAPEQRRAVFELTMPTHKLSALLIRLRGEAERLLQGSREEREARRADAALEERFRVGPP